MSNPFQRFANAIMDGDDLTAWQLIAFVPLMLGAIGLAMAEGTWERFRDWRTAVAPTRAEEGDGPHD